jgi:hypothetical protein
MKETKLGTGYLDVRLDMGHFPVCLKQRLPTPRIL